METCSCTSFKKMISYTEVLERLSFSERSKRARVSVAVQDFGSRSMMNFLDFCFLVDVNLLLLLMFFFYR